MTTLGPLAELVSLLDEDGRRLLADAVDRLGAGMAGKAATGTPDEARGLCVAAGVLAATADGIREHQEGE